jgi:cysteinyl-tRNA synthetase
MELYNTMSRQVEEVTPREGEGNRLTMYTCGLTVYSEPQIGNWVAYIYSDVLTRVLLANDFDIRRIQNITDVGHLVSDDDDGEDKMEKGAKRENMTAWDVAAKYSELSQQQAYDQLGLLRPAELVPATSCIDKQIEFASALEEKGYLYRTPDGMYFDTSKVSDYGKLARLDIAGLEPGARVDMAGKRNITDFAVWKFSPEGAKRDMEWDSPWGVGFPGWHLECSTIILENLGEQIDIHTGGIDHIPVHHTNEIAQTESLTDKQFVRYWFHNNHMKVDGTKLSKSLGNSYTLDDITSRGYSLDAFKLLVLSSHYRPRTQPAVYSIDQSPSATLQCHRSAQSYF